MNLASGRKLSTQIQLIWKANAAKSEWTFHQLSPYIGKLKSSAAKSLVESFTNYGDVVYDPFCGAGTIPLESWVAGRRVIANDLNLYAHILTRAKLNPPLSLESVLKKLEHYRDQVTEENQSVDLRKVPIWVRKFFNPLTLKEVIRWCNLLIKEEEYFILSCLMGILHHQRPGFLSYPSSHSVPYLRIKKFPKQQFPKLYEYRALYERLEKKVIRSFKNSPVLDYTIERNCFRKDAVSFFPEKIVDVIITSPPYMRKLDYARDNRLRLWFLGVNETKALDQLVSPSESVFLNSFRKCLENWKKVLRQGGKCILILGDSNCRTYKARLPKVIETIALQEVGGYQLEVKFQSIIPEKRRVRRNNRGNDRETVLVLRRI